MDSDTISLVDALSGLNSRDIDSKEILAQYRNGDPDASYIVGVFLISGRFSSSDGESEQHGLEILCDLANKGHAAARKLLNGYCEKKYSDEVSKKIAAAPAPAPLCDFDGKKIKIDRHGLLTPVDMKLDFVDGRNILTLNLNLTFMCDWDIEDTAAFEKAVVQGVKDWQGDYEVFGGQKITVVVNVSKEMKCIDAVYVITVTKDVEHCVRKLNAVVATGEKKKRTEEVFDDKRSFATSGVKWSVYSRKNIAIQCDDGKFDNYPEIRAVAKHEFGHVLGLGDLYEEKSDHLSGIEFGKYEELDAYYISRRFYNLVMCDHHGPVSNNDIEMVILAFRDNDMQLYQPQNFKGKISMALGKGN